MRPLMVSAGFVLGLACAANAIEITSGFGFARSQFTYPGVSLPPTNYGVMAVDYSAPEFAGGGFG